MTHQAHLLNYDKNNRSSNMYDTLKSVANLIVLSLVFLTENSFALNDQLNLSFDSG